MSSDSDTVYTSRYPIINVAVDLALFRLSGRDLKTWEVLLIERGEDPYKGRRALPGGHLDEYEKPEDAARRECREETGVEPDLIRFVCMLDHPDRDPRGRTISYLYGGIVDRRVRHVAPEGMDDAAWAGWVPVGEAILDRRDMAFDHSRALWRAATAMDIPR